MFYYLLFDYLLMYGCEIYRVLGFRRSLRSCSNWHFNISHCHRHSFHRYAHLDINFQRFFSVSSFSSFFFFLLFFSLFLFFVFFFSISSMRDWYLHLLCSYQYLPPHFLRPSLLRSHQLHQRQRPSLLFHQSHQLPLYQYSAATRKHTLKLETSTIMAMEYRRTL